MTTATEYVVVFVEVPSGSRNKYELDEDRLQHAIHRSLMRSIARTNTQLARLIAHHQLMQAARNVQDLEVAIRAQMWQPL